MPMLNNNLAEWIDIKKLLIRASQERSRFGLDQISIPEKAKNITATKDISTLSSLINDLSKNSFLGTVASTQSISLPNKGNILTPLALTSLSNVLSTIESKTYVTPYCGTHFGGHKTSSYGNRANCPAFFDSHDSSYFSSDDSGYCNHCESFHQSFGADNSFFRCFSGFTWFSGTNAPHCGSFENVQFSGHNSYDAPVGSRSISCDEYNGTCGCFNDFNNRSFFSGYFSSHFSAYHASAYFASGFTTAFNAAGFCSTFNASAFVDSLV